MSFSPLPCAKFHFVRQSVHVDPVHDGRLIGDGSDQAGMLCSRVCEIISLERMAECNVIIPSSIDVEL